MSDGEMRRLVEQRRQHNKFDMSRPPNVGTIAGVRDTAVPANDLQRMIQGRGVAPERVIGGPDRKLFMPLKDEEELIATIKFGNLHGGRR